MYPSFGEARKTYICPPSFLYTANALFLRFGIGDEQPSRPSSLVVEAAASSSDRHPAASRQLMGAQLKVPIFNLSCRWV